MADKLAGETPLMGQYNRIKASYPDALLLFRVGDFYETFGEDAVKTSSILGIVLTRRANGAATHIQLAGFPYHSLDTYLPRLVKAGNRVAICDQLEDPALVKGIVKRGVTELISPGITYNSQLLPQRTGNYLAAVMADKGLYSVALCDISTGEFKASSGSKDFILKLMHTFGPAEILIEGSQLDNWRQILGDRYFFKLERWVFTSDYTAELLLKHFNVTSLDGFGFTLLPQALIAAGVCLHYIRSSFHTSLSHIVSLSRIEEDEYVWLDKFTLANLELLQPANEGGTSLLECMDHTVSASGARLLRSWLSMPLRSLAEIDRRQCCVQTFTEHPPFLRAMRDELSVLGDLERLIARVALLKAGPRELIGLASAVRTGSRIKNLAKDSSIIRTLTEKLDGLDGLASRIEHTIEPAAPPLLAKGNVIRQGVDPRLDDLRGKALKGKDFLLNLQKTEIERTGISSLKISFNSVHGYYFEVTHAHRDKVPPTWMRKQTLVGAERYITAELKEFEEEISGAEQRISVLEHEIFQALITSVLPFLSSVQTNAKVLAAIDVLASFSEVATRYGYAKPVLNDGFALSITDGRHPVIEQRLPAGETYVANSISVDSEKEQILMITGPNMSGKSALLRQTALIVLLAQTGSFVPAKSAVIGLTDKIFSRVGASDNIAQGSSTFMMEMIETSSILNNLSSRSLLILDEIGRGTSTYDGISLAWAIAAFLHDGTAFKPKTLFATHYHELNEMENKYARIANYQIMVKKSEKRVLFLRKLARGASSHSFGIQVAKMAGIPLVIVDQASAMLEQLEKQRQTVGLPTDVEQLALFPATDPIFTKAKKYLAKLDLNNITPLDSLLRLNELKQMLTK